MCCDPVGSNDEMTRLYDACGQPTDKEGISADICGYSPIDCEECGAAYCDDSC